ncbi:hypothetical protein AB5J62_37335 [Amycolatopsis sp. cg5]|uniref:oxygenase MpaB family protein n=1 Tax=Amycolatopsis sp. cg5 TaxID=3238802 RepID=UPI0035232939
MNHPVPPGERVRAAEPDPALGMRSALAGRQSTDYYSGLMLALVHVFAIPRYSALLIDSGEYSRDPLSRHAVTVNLLRTVVSSGFESKPARSAIRRMAHAHRRAGLSADDMRFALAAFVVIPRQWSERVLSRPWPEAKTSAVIAFYTRLGELTGVIDLPRPVIELERLVEEHLSAHARYARTNEALLDAALDHLTRRWPRRFRRWARTATAVLLDCQVRTAFGLPAPSALDALVASVVLRAHGKVGGRLPRIMITRRSE